ncbi:porin [Pseudoxanthomonas dokdonensis]|uniref:Porin n=2 Tax=Pseudoxanthomonas dokdonensis TaxID=344882 RepID=A0A0R0CJT4_9GAMM|nr:porin [Pseudoxanthomonas dokdonensis]
MAQSGSDTASASELRAEITAMRQQLDALERRLQALEAPGAQGRAIAPVNSPPAAPASVADGAQTEPAGVVASAAVSPPDTQSMMSVPGVEASVLAPRESVSDPSLAASRPDSQAAPTDAELKGFMPIPGTETRFRIGGYAKLDAMYDPHAVGNDDNFVTSLIPLDDTPGTDAANFNLHAKQTRFNLEARRPTPLGNLRFYLENDFYGSSSGYEYRLRHAYGQIGNTYAGYGYSNFMDADALPDTLDFEGPGSTIFLFIAGVQHSFKLGRHLHLSVAAEDPQTQLDGGNAQVDGVTNAMPDLSARLRLERERGHLQLAGLYRRLGYIDGDDKHHDQAGGLSLTGSRSLGDRDLLLFGGHWGQGMARYVSDIGGSNRDAVIDSQGRLHALTSYGGYFGYTHYWSADWRSNLVYGRLHMPDEDFLAGDAFADSRYGALNLIWSRVPSWTMGMELLYGQYQQQDGRDGDALRLQGSLQYNFIK